MEREETSFDGFELHSVSLHQVEAVLLVLDHIVYQEQYGSQDTACGTPR